ncbi:MAG: hypothetical protein ABGW87_13295 [Sphingomonadaceae bacterium]
MILRLGSGWQTVTADLALILFMVTAQALQETPVTPAPPAGPSKISAAPSPPPDMDDLALASGAILAIYRPGSGTTLADWLDSTITDDRQATTVYVRYAPGRRSLALMTGSRLVDEVEQDGHKARLVVAPANVSEAMVVVAYSGADTDGTGVAYQDSNRGRSQGHTP